MVAWNFGLDPREPWTRLGSFPGTICECVRRFAISIINAKESGARKCLYGKPYFRQGGLFGWIGTGGERGASEMRIVGRVDWIFGAGREGLGFDVLGVFAVGVAGAAPELVLGFSGGAVAHGLAAEGAERGASLRGAGCGRRGGVGNNADRKAGAFRDRQSPSTLLLGVSMAGVPDTECEDYFPGWLRLPTWVRLLDGALHSEACRHVAGFFGLRLTGLRRGTTWLQRGREGVSSVEELGDWDQSPSRATILKPPRSASAGGCHL
jgi:hypothetical protein